MVAIGDKSATAASLKLWTQQAGILYITGSEVMDCSFEIITINLCMPPFFNFREPHFILHLNLPFGNVGKFTF